MREPTNASALSLDELPAALQAAVDALGDALAAGSDWTAELDRAAQRFAEVWEQAPAEFRERISPGGDQFVLDLRLRRLRSRSAEFSRAAQGEAQEDPDSLFAALAGEAADSDRTHATELLEHLQNFEGASPHEDA